MTSPDAPPPSRWKNWRSHPASRGGFSECLRNRALGKGSAHGAANRGRAAAPGPLGGENPVRRTRAGRESSPTEGSLAPGGTPIRARAARRQDRWRRGAAAIPIFPPPHLIFSIIQIELPASPRSHPRRATTARIRRGAIADLVPRNGPLHLWLGTIAPSSGHDGRSRFDEGYRPSGRRHFDRYRRADALEPGTPRHADTQTMGGLLRHRCRTRGMATGLGHPLCPSPKQRPAWPRARTRRSISACPTISAKRLGAARSGLSGRAYVTVDRGGQTARAAGGILPHRHRPWRKIGPAAAG